MATSPASPGLQDNVDVVGARAVVEWSSVPGQTCRLPSSDFIASEADYITFDLYCRPATSIASLRIRAPIMLKGLGRKTTPLFLFIPPERIESVGLFGQDETKASEDVLKELGGSGAVSMRFKLTQPGDLVVPPQDPFVPKKKIYWDMFDSLKSLAGALEFVLYLSPDRIPSGASARSVADALSAGKFATSIAHADISRLYDGKGGKLLTCSDLLANKATTSGLDEPLDSPPSYEKLGPGPPAPPIEKDTQYIAEDSSSNSRKRRRKSSASSNDSPTDVRRSAAVDTAQLEAICRKLMGEMASQWRAEGENQLRSELQAMEARMRDWVDERLRTHANDLKDEIHRTSVQQQQDYVDDSVQVIRDEVEIARAETQDTMDKIDEVQENLGRAKEETEEVIDGRVDERVEVLRAELEEYVADQVAEAENRVIDRLRSSVCIDFNIYDT